jgi:hypothetical protein
MLTLSMYDTMFVDVEVVMSDGPSKALKNLPRGWRRVARSAEMGASSSDEIAQNIEQALIDDGRKIPPKLISELRKAFGDGRQRLLGLNEHETLDRSCFYANGSVFGALLVSHARLVINEGRQGEDALREAIARALREWITDSARQIEELLDRQTCDGHTSRIRELIESSATLIDLVNLANQLLGIGTTPARPPAQKLTGIEDGPRL